MIAIAVFISILHSKFSSNAYFIFNCSSFAPSTCFISLIPSSLHPLPLFFLTFLSSLFLLPFLSSSFMSVFANLFFLYIVMNTTVVRQRFGKHVPKAKNRQAIIHFLGTGSANMFPWQREKQNNMNCSRWWCTSMFGSPERPGSCKRVSPVHS
jgi:hypothetical protein